MTERKLATIRLIEEVKPIEGADKICAYRVDGWWIVDQVGKYKVNDLVIYCEVDSFVPHDLAPFLSKGKEPREFEGIKGERLRTIKLKGQVSQGLLLPLIVIEYNLGKLDVEWIEGDDVTSALGIIKYEKPIPAQLAGLIRGNFPSEIPKTDQERIQNLTKEFEGYKQFTWTVTEKVDGTSCTFYLDQEGEFHVCSRNLDLKRDENNTYWKMAIKLDIEQKMRDNSLSGVALQGEIIGGTIQGNQYKYSELFMLFDVYDTRISGYYGQSNVFNLACDFGLEAVPFLHTHFSIQGDDVASLLKYAEGKSQLNDSQREGLVFQCEQNPNLSFKVISNAWLLKNE